MTPPRELYHVEWTAAVDFDHPNDQRPRDRRFRTETDAARQILAVLAMPSHLTLTGVWRTIPGTNALDWERIDPRELRPLDVDRARYRELVDGWRSNPAMAPYVGMLPATDQEGHACPIP